MLAYNHSTRIHSMMDYGWNLAKTVLQILEQGLRPNAKNIMVFVHLDGFEIKTESGEQITIKVGDQCYPLFVESTDHIHYAGDVIVKYWSDV